MMTKVSVRKVEVKSRQARLQTLTVSISREIQVKSIITVISPSEVIHMDFRIRSAPVQVKQSKLWNHILNIKVLNQIVKNQNK